MARYQPASLAAMEGRFESGPMAEIVLIGQPNVREKRLDNPIVVPGVLSFLAFGTFHANVAGLDQFPVNTWPDNIELLYYSFHIMAGLGTLFILTMAVAMLLEWRGSLVHEPADALGPDARVSVSVHRHDRGLDDGGAGTPAVDRLRPDADGRTAPVQRCTRGRRCSR